MRKLIVVRVAEYQIPGETLTAHGRETFRALSLAIKAQVGHSTVLLMSSDAKRAVACAAIIGEILGVEAEIHHELFSDACNPPDLLGGFRLTRAREGSAEVIVLVTNYDFVGQFPAHYARMKGFVAYSWSVEKASALMLDCRTHEMQHIRPP